MVLILEKSQKLQRKQGIGINPHHHLAPSDCVDVPVEDILDGCAGAQTAYSGASALVTPNTLDLVVRRRVLDSDAFISVGDFDVVNPVVIP